MYVPLSKSLSVLKAEFICSGQTHVLVFLDQSQSEDTRVRSIAHPRSTVRCSRRRVLNAVLEPQPTATSRALGHRRFMESGCSSSACARSRQAPTSRRIRACGTFNRSRAVHHAQYRSRPRLRLGYTSTSAYVVRRTRLKPASRSRPERGGTVTEETGHPPDGPEWECGWTRGCSAAGR